MVLVLQFHRHNRIPRRIGKGIEVVRQRECIFYLSEVIGCDLGGGERPHIGRNRHLGARYHRILVHIVYGDGDLR